MSVMWRSFSFFIFCVVVTSVIAKCGYESCHKEVPGMLNVHMVSHTHADPGYILTVDQYYYRYIQFILDTAVGALDENPDRRFTFVEMSFFYRWWREQKESVKEKVRRLVNEGRFEFTMGGWVMNDEAAVHYSAIIDQHALGFDFLRNNFGNCSRTKVGWQLDPFGHSREQASMFAQFGFDGMFFGRLDWQDKENRQAIQTMETIWRASPDNLGQASELFTGVLPNNYQYPGGFAFDVSRVFKTTNAQKFIYDDIHLNDYNVDEMVDNFIGNVTEYQSWYGTNHVIVTMGADFNYVDAFVNFKEIDKLIKHVNARQASGSKVNLLYSTPSCYLKAINGDGKTFSSMTDDFFPYASRNHTYWTGYFTSRPALKGYTRRLNSLLQSAKQLTSFSRLNNSHGAMDKLYNLATSLAVAQHHDAITGTEFQAVAYDYAQSLAIGEKATQEAVNEAYSVLMSKGQGKSVDQLFCNYLNVSVCTVSRENKKFEVTFYNSLTWAVNYTARIPVDGQSYSVLSDNGKTDIKNDIFPVRPAPAGIRPKGTKAGKGELVFTAHLPPLGFATYFVQEKETKLQTVVLQTKNGTVLKGKYVEVHFDKDGQVNQLINRGSGVKVPFQQNFFYYKPFVGNDSTGEFQGSGAYIFRPASNTPVKLKLTKWEGIVKGSVVQEARQKFTDWLTQSIRVYDDKAYVEFEWTIGPMPTDQGGREVFSRYNIANWGNKGVFFTGSNGREILQRRLNYRPNWKVDVDEPVAGNYYPVCSHINIKSGDSKNQLTVLTDRAQGGTSLNDGDVELMIHRRLTHPDMGKGHRMRQPLNEPGLDGKGLIIRGSHYVLMDSVENSAGQFRPLAQEVLMTGQTTFSNSGLSPASYVQQYNTRWSGLDLPEIGPSIKLLTLEKFRDGAPVGSPAGSIPYLVRFEHIFEAKEDTTHSAEVTFDLQSFFRELAVVDATELSLGGNIPAVDIHRLHWKYRANSTTTVTAAKLPLALDGTTLKLKPMQIVTLQVNFKV